MLNRYATAILGSLGTITVFTSYVAMYRNGTGAIYLGLLGFALIGSAMLVQRVRDLTLEVEDLERDTARSPSGLRVGDLARFVGVAAIYRGRVGIVEAIDRRNVLVRFDGLEGKGRDEIVNIPGFAPRPGQGDGLHPMSDDELQAISPQEVEDLERDYDESVDQTQRYMRMAKLRLRQIEDLEWELESAKVAAEDWKHIFGMANDGAFDA